MLHVRVLLLGALLRNDEDARELDARLLPDEFLAFRQRGALHVFFIASAVAARCDTF
jgi:hypothetical protein